MFWQIASFPACDHHIFLSHCAEDKPWLVDAVCEELKRREIIPWLDREDYYYGRDSRAALRDGLLRCRHVVFFVTLAMLDYRRGWCLIELAYADLLQANLLGRGGPLLNFELPLFFIDQVDPQLPRTAWNLLRDRGAFHQPADGDPLAWAVERISGFLRQEQRLALEMARFLAPGQPDYDELAGRPGLLERLTRFDPGPIP